MRSLRGLRLSLGGLPRGRMSELALIAVAALCIGLFGRLAGVLLSRTSAAPAPPAPRVLRQLTLQNPYAASGSDADQRWWKGNLHVASSWSGGKDLPRALGDYYRAHGYDFLGISDANTYTWVESYQSRSLTGVPTVLASYAFGDVLALGMAHWASADDLQGAVDWIVADGGLPILIAPRWHETPDVAGAALGLHHLFGMEIYNARVAALAPDEADATGLWDDLLTRGDLVWGLAGDDARSLTGKGEPKTAGSAWIEVLASDAGLHSLLTAIRLGAFYASTGPAFTGFDVQGRTLAVHADGATALRFIGKGGRLLQTLPGSAGSYTSSGGEGYVRVEAVGVNGTRAWSQPFFLTWL